MKSFLSAFAVCLIGCLLLLFFSTVLFKSLWPLAVLASMFLAALINLLLRQEERLESLEKRIEQLEKDGEPSAGEE